MKVACAALIIVILFNGELFELCYLMVLLSITEWMVVSWLNLDKGLLEWIDDRSKEVQLRGLQLRLINKLTSIPLLNAHMLHSYVIIIRYYFPRTTEFCKTNSYIL